MDTVTNKPSWERLKLERRALFFTLTIGTSTIAGGLMFDILRLNGLTSLELVSLMLFPLLFTWIAGSFWTAVIGFCLQLKRRPDPAVIQAASLPDGEPLRTRTAVVMPIYNEEVGRVAAGIDAIWRSLIERPEQAAFDFFILSDTRDEAHVAAEKAMWQALVHRYGAQGRIFYRHRTNNTGRKAGNIADFVRNWGAAYEYMVILDADSIMTGQALVTLARLMDRHPQAGLMQTLPLLAGGGTLFARMLQFATRLNGPMLASGLAFWHLGDSNYWGHNAILRVRPFADHCGLPRLSGVEPLGGEILSHDFVEAAFMRAAGHEVWLVPDVPGSWEELPSNEIDYAARDRRWTQGNLQHLRILPRRGLRWLSRVHLLTGILGYLTAPAWFALLLLSSVMACMEALQGPRYFELGIRMLPQWPQFRPGEIAALLTMTVIVLLLPKFMGAVLALRDSQLRRAFGGGGRLGLSLLLEQLFSLLLAPAMMVFHSMFVLQTFAGKTVRWQGQDRSNRGLGIGEAFARFKWHTALGVVWGIAIALLAPKFIGWMAPVLAGLLLSIPLAMVTSRADLGRRSRELGLFLVPEEFSPPPELENLRKFDLRELQKDLPPDPVLPVPARAPMRMEPPPTGRFDKLGVAAGE